MMERRVDGAQLKCPSNLGLRGASRFTPLR